MQSNTNHRNRWDIVVPIKEEHVKSMPFEDKGITARSSCAIILAFFGYCSDVLALMQELSHKTRAYIWNAQGLPGFLIKADLLHIHTQLDKKGDLKKITKNQDFTLETIKAKYLDHKDSQGQLTFFYKFYPCLYVFIQQRYGTREKLEKYMQNCKNVQSENTYFK